MKVQRRNCVSAFQGFQESQKAEKIGFTKTRFDSALNDLRVYDSLCLRISEKLLM